MIAPCGMSQDQRPIANVAEEVVFIAEARIIKHHAEEAGLSEFGRT